MEDQIFTLLQGATWATVAGLFVWLVLAPLTRYFIKKNGGNNADALEKVEEIQSNDLSEIRRDIRELKKGQGDMRERMARVETKVFNKNP